MKKISGIQEILFSAFLLLDLWSKDNLLSSCVFWHSLRSNVDSYFDPNLKVTISLEPPLDEQDRLYAESFYIISPDKKDSLSDNQMQEFEGQIYRLICEAKYKEQSVLVVERKKKFYCFDKEIFLSLFQRLSN